MSPDGSPSTTKRSHPNLPPDMDMGNFAERPQQQRTRQAMHSTHLQHTETTRPCSQTHSARRETALHKRHGPHSRQRFMRYPKEDARMQAQRGLCVCATSDQAFQRNLKPGTNSQPSGEVHESPATHQAAAACAVGCRMQKHDQSQPWHRG